MVLCEITISMITKYSAKGFLPWSQSQSGHGQGATHSGRH